jgi:hypothetical protein
MLWWLVPVVVLLLAIGWETDWGREVNRPAPAAESLTPQRVETALLPEYAIAGGTSSRTETVTRTLFNPTRRPAPPMAAENAATRVPRGQFTLTGTTVVEGKSAAFLRDTTGKSRRVQVGETISGAVVAEVTPDRVKLKIGDEEEELRLRVVANPRITTQPIAPAVPAQPVGAIPPVAVPPVPAALPAGVSPAETPASAAERRRAARAAAAGAAAQQPNVTPTPAVPVTPQPAAQPDANAAAAGQNTADPRWQEIYRRYQQQQR